MNVTVTGLWHLGCVTAACCARHFRVVGYDPDDKLVAPLRKGHPPILEPGLDELIRAGLDAGRLRFTADPREACREADVLWCAWDTPVNDRDESDVAFVLDRLRPCLGQLPDGALALISSQLPVGTCRSLEAEFPRLHVACSPENLRLGRALEAFSKPDRIVVGHRNDTVKPTLTQLFAPFTSNLLWMRTESAEVVKHSLNAFLALSIAYINEIARLCEKTGADAREVSAGLRSDVRIGPKAYLDAGGPFAGGTLARDVVTLNRLGADLNEPLHLIPAIQPSNDHHRDWASLRLEERLGGVNGRTITVLGLTYTPHTNTLRRSAAVDLCRRLLEAGAIVRAFDPAVPALPPVLSAVRVAEDLAGALQGADAAVVCTEWPQFRQADWRGLLPVMRRRLVIDPGGFLEKCLNTLDGVEHLCVGHTS